MRATTLSSAWPILALASAVALPRAVKPNSTCSVESSEYDFIVVGGGTAGLAVASRLSTYLPDDCILVIEAGPTAFDNDGINIPGMKGSTLGGPLDWNFTSIAQSDANDRIFPINRGKVLGGSSALNLMTWDRGSIPDYNAWEELGNPGWDWENFITAMEAVETFQNDSRYGDEGVGYEGPIQTLINRVVPEQQDGFIPALQALGVPNNLNSLGGDNIGVMFQPSNVRASNYTRSYAPTYLTIASPNLHYLVNTTVDRITLSTNSTPGLVTATGVQIGSTTLTARKEVILSAGSIQSPQLLELSGIGQPSILTAANITTILPLPGVGENFQDHLRVENQFQLKPEYQSFDDLRLNATLAAEQLALYRNDSVSLYDYTGSGYAYLTWDQVLGCNTTSPLLPLALQSANTSNPVDAKKLSYLTTSPLNTTVPQLEIIFSDGYTGFAGFPNRTNVRYGQRFFTLIAVIQHPFSRGSVHLNSSSPTSHPLIDPNYLAQPYDLQSLIEAVKFNRKIAEQPALRDYWIDEKEPGLNITSDADIAAYAKSTVLSIYHPMGTCAMLPLADDGVVDPDLIVYGTANLRVVDSSVIPVQPSAHLQTMVYGIAERAARIIAARWS